VRRSRTPKLNGPAQLRDFHACASRASSRNAEGKRGTTFHKQEHPSTTNVLRSTAVASDDASTVTEACAHLLSLAAHEFRTPANVVGGYLRMLQRDTAHTLSEQQRQMIDEAQKSCARIVVLINELSEIANLDTDPAAIDVESFDLFQLIGELVDDLHEAEDRDVHLQLCGEARGASVSGDRIRLRGAFSAFFRAMLREQPSASIAAVDRRLVRREGRASAVVVVAPETDVQRAYEAPAAPFDEGRGGLGLALPIARRVIERHGGRVWTPALNGSDDPGARSAVIVSLPVCETREPAR
jgi:light-regulated signal transduction histidine kinase (bacteriophytochrome)